MIGLGCAMSCSTLPSMKNALLYFPNKKGLINGIVLFGFGSSSLIFTSVADKIINPEFKKVNPSTGFFDKEIADRVHIYMKYMNLIVGIAACSAFLLIFQFKEEKNENKEKEEQKINESKDLNKIEEKKEEEKIVKDALQQAFKSKQVYQLIIMNCAMTLFGITVVNTNRTFAQLNQVDEKILSTLAKVYAILNGFSRLIWGILFDKCTFKVLYSMCVISQIVIGVSLYYIVHYPYVFFVTVLSQAIILSGNVSLIMTTYSKIYGIKNFVIIFSTANIMGGISTILGPIIIKLIIKSKEDYKTLYWGGAVICIICLITLIFFDEKKFEYKTEDENKEKELIEKS